MTSSKFTQFFRKKNVQVTLILSVLLLFQGIGNGTTISIDETSITTQTKWESLSTTGTPPATDIARMVYDSFNDRTIMFGGVTSGGRVDTTYEFNSATNEWNLLSPTVKPSARSGHNMVYDSQNDVTVLFGGYDGNYKADTLEFNYTENTWASLSPSVSPEPRYHHMMTYDSVNDKILLFGGINSTHFFNDTWSYDFGLNTWTKMSPSIAPPGRSSSILEFDPLLGKAVLFGGNKVNQAYTDTWTYDFITDTWEQLHLDNSPVGRWDHGSAYDAKNQMVITFGGRNNYKGGVSYYQNTHALDIANNRWIRLWPVGVPSARADVAMNYDMGAGKVILFGGQSGGVKIQDTWALSWSRQLFTPQPGEMYPQEVRIYQGGSTNDHAVDLFLRPDGGYCHAGFTESPTLGMDSGSINSGGRDIYFYCYDQNGNQQEAVFSGGSGNDDLWALTVNSANAIITAGYTDSSDWGFDATAYQGGGDGWVWIWDYDSGVSYRRAIGGSAAEAILDLSLDNQDNILLVGHSQSSSLTTGFGINGGHDTIHSGTQDLIVAKLDPLGNHIWSTYVGGNGNEHPQSIVADSQDNIWVYGHTTSTDLETTAGAQQTTRKGSDDYFVQKYDKDGNLLFSSYVGGSSAETPLNEMEIAVDSNDDVIFMGQSSSLDFPTTTGSLNQSDNGGTNDAVMFKYASDGSFVWGTYFGGNLTDTINTVTVDENDDIWFSGHSESANVPILNGFQDIKIGGTLEGIIGHISGDGSQLLYSTYYGSFGHDYIYSHKMQQTGELLIYGSATLANHLPGYQEDGARGGRTNWDVYVTHIYPDKIPETVTDLETSVETTVETSVETTVETTVETSVDTEITTDTEVITQTVTEPGDISTVTDTGGASVPLITIYVTLIILVLNPLKFRKNKINS